MAFGASVALRLVMAKGSFSSMPCRTLAPSVTGTPLLNFCRSARKVLRVPDPGCGTIGTIVQAGEGPGEPGMWAQVRKESRVVGEGAGTVSPGGGVVVRTG